MTAAALDTDEAGMTRLAALTGWCPAGEAAFEAEELTSALRVEAMR